MSAACWADLVVPRLALSLGVFLHQAGLRAGMLPDCVDLVIHLPIISQVSLPVTVLANLGGRRKPVHRKTHR